jgi:U3 small nucleolar RNA-associated protein 7
VDWNKYAVSAEFHVHETVRDAVFLHNHNLFAVAQKKYAYIYDHTGAEVHVMRNHAEPAALEFLPYHFLLASIGSAGWLKYQDVSTGALVAEHRTKLGSCDVLRQNPWNAVLCCGHSNGAVTMWTPNMSTAAVKIAAHKGPVTALAVDSGGRYMVSGGMDGRLKVWDVRKMREVHSYFTATPARSIDVSQRGMVAVGFGSHVQVWGRDFALEGAKGGLLDKVNLPPPLPRKARKAGAGAGAGGVEEDEVDEDEEEGPDMSNPFVRRALAVSESGVKKAVSPYMRHELPGRAVATLRFRPYDDVLAIGHSGGLASIIVPGSGEPSYDTLEADPYAGKKARQEAEVHALLDKLAPSMISLEPSAVGAVDRTAPAVRAKEARDAAAAAKEAAGPPAEKKRKRRGIRKALKKQANIITEQKVALLEKLKEEKAARSSKEGAEGGGAAPAEDAAGPRSALSRFYK